MKNIITINSITAVFLAVCIAIGCKKKEDENDNTVVLPSNLVVNVTVDESNFGFVSVKATADKANFYTITFTENEESVVERTTSGEASYTYSKEGTYTILARAHTSENEFIEKTEQVKFVSDEVVREPGTPPTEGYSTPDNYSGYTLVWQDEFNGTSLSTSNWQHEIGTGSSGWGNNELQYYKAENTSVKDGLLTIVAKQEIFNASGYTSSRIITKDLQSFQYGRIDIRAAMPYGQGIWPALWMLGDNFKTSGWPQCGEIDIMEMVGGATTSKKGDNNVHGTVHWADNDNKHAEFSGSKTISEGKLYDKFHVYSIIWDANSITWYLDDVSYHSINTSEAQFDEFRQKFFFIFNVAVGGNWPGDPDSETTFPQYMYVDYVRVFQK